MEVLQRRCDGSPPLPSPPRLSRHTHLPPRPCVSPQLRDAAATRAATETKSC